MAAPSEAKTRPAFYFAECLALFAFRSAALKSPTLGNISNNFSTIRCALFTRLSSVISNILRIKKIDQTGRTT
jgi:hypothetical protein